MTIVEVQQDANAERKAPTASEKRIFLIIAAAYAGLVLTLLPWASEPGMNNPRITAVSAVGIMFADFCAALLLGAWYRLTGRAPLLALTCGYVYSGIMAALHMAVFPGALFTLPLFGSDHTVGWLYSAWRGGTALAYLLAVLLEVRGGDAAPAQGRQRRLALACSLVVLGCVFLGVVAASIPANSMSGTQWTPANMSLVWVWIGVYGAALTLIVAKRAFNERFYLWLALVLVAAMADTVLGNIGGGRYTISWHASRTSFVVSAYLLLVFLISDLAERLPRSPLTTLAAYGAAIATACASILLRWFLDPWIGAGVPYITLFAAVALSVWLGGWGPALLCAGLGYAMANMFFVGRFGSLEIASAAEMLQLVVYAVCCVLIIGLGEGMRRARNRYRASEAALKEHAAELRHADERKSQFLALLSHELRNPLAPLRTSLAILKLAPDGAAAAQAREIMERQIAQMTRLIDELLDMSRIDRGKLELRRERVALDVVVRTALETAKPGIDSKSHELVVRYASQPLYVDADASRLAQVIANLLNNAAKFTPPHGRIELAMRAEEGHAVLTISDTGIGLAPEHLRVIFDMFVQVDTGRTAATGGLGLGLSIVRSIVEGHGGHVMARSAGLGQGAEFTVRIPLASAPVAAPVEQGAILDVTGTRRILVVDDNREAADSISELLRLKGHRVGTAYDGATALRIADDLNPDIAFIDLDMPGMDGCELARRLRATPGRCNAELIALTGLGQDSDVQRSREAGFDLHLTKPADPERILTLAAGARADNVIAFHKAPRSGDASPMKHNRETE